MATTLPSTRRGRETRARIVQAAVDVIAERGATGMSLERVIDAAGVSKGQLYHYFADRDAVVHAAVGATIDNVVGFQSSVMNQLDTWPGIEAWFDCLVDLQVNVGAHGGCPMAALAAHLVETDEHARRQILAGFEQWEDALADGLIRMRDAGTLVASSEPRQLATATMASVQGGLILTQVRRDPTQLRIALDAAMTHLMSFAAGGDT